MNHDYEDNSSLYIDDPTDNDSILLFLNLDKKEDLDLLDPVALYEEYGVTIDECKHPNKEILNKMINHFLIYHDKGAVKR